MTLGILLLWSSIRSRGRTLAGSPGVLGEHHLPGICIRTQGNLRERGRRAREADGKGRWNAPVRDIKYLDD